MNHRFTKIARGICLFTVFLLGTASTSLAEEPASGPPLPLKAPAFQTLPLGSVRPEGWLKRQLEIQAAGMTGHLHEFWPDIRDSGWTGGKAEGWERMPYWLDGAVPLAYLLDDAKLKTKVSESIDYILKHQQEDGWLGPVNYAGPNNLKRDPWPVFVMLKVLAQYYEATGDERVLPAMERFFQALDKHIDQRPLYEWNKMRWQDCVLMIHWLYDRRRQVWLQTLATKLQRQGFDWQTHLQNLPFKEKVPKWEHNSHVVNIAMGVKTPAILFRQAGDGTDRTAAGRILDVLDQFHGQVAGQFSGDECLAGRMPSQGTETCAIVEYMYSLEMLMAALGEPKFGDRLELLAFNALPASCSEDMWTRQYVQQANQPVSRKAGKPIYTTNGPDANLFGLETNFGCCTANMHQGWPKFAANLWMKKGRGLAAVAYAPSRVETTFEGKKVRVELATDYPFRDQLNFTVTVEQPTQFEIALRIPAWAKGGKLMMYLKKSVEVQPGTFHVIDRTWTGETRFSLRLPLPLMLERRYNDAVAIRRGPLVFSLPVGESWKVLAGQPPKVTYEVTPTTPWNYALEIDEQRPEASVRFEELPVGESPFSKVHPGVKAKVQGRLLPSWTLEQDAAAPPPKSPVTSDEPLTELTLIPYGAAKLRVTEFPTLAK